MAIRHSFQNSRGIELVADHYASDSDSIVVLVHGYTSNKRWRGRFPHIGAALNEAGFAAFAYDSSGCGESGDDSLRLDKLVQDVRDAVAEVRELGYQRVALWGHSLGARSCIAANPPGVVTMVLSSAGTAPMHYHWPDYYAAADLATLAATGKMTVPADDGVRDWVTIEAQMLRDFAEFDQQALLGALSCPVLIVNGNNPEDWEECALLEGNRRGEQWLPSGSRLHVVEGARHNFAEHLGELAQVGVDWLFEKMQ